MLRIIVCIFLSIVYIAFIGSYLSGADPLSRSGFLIYSPVALLLFIAFSNQNASGSVGNITNTESENFETIESLKPEQVRYENTVYLTKEELVAIMKKRRMVWSKRHGSLIMLKVENVGAESNSQGKSRNVTCFANSEILYNEVSNIRLIRAGFELYKKADYKQADKIFNEYLKRVQFTFSILSTTACYSTIRAGDEISARIKHVVVKHKEHEEGPLVSEYLTLDLNSIVILEPESPCAIQKR